MDKIRTGQFQIDSELKQITFNDVRFYTPDMGKTYVPSVTTILDAYPKTAAFFDWLKKNGEDADRIRDEAGERGSIVHQLTERYDNGEVISLIDADGIIRYKAREWKDFEKYVEFNKLFNPEVLMNEFNIISLNLNIAGTIDRYIVLKGKRYLLDIKTSNALHDHYWLQLAAYANLFKEAFPEDKIDGVCILWLNAKTRAADKAGKSIQGKGWQLVFPDRDIEHYWNLFKYTQALWNEVNGDMKPNNLTYSIEHKK